MLVVAVAVPVGAAVVVVLVAVAVAVVVLVVLLAACCGFDVVEMLAPMTGKDFQRTETILVDAG